MLELTFAAVSVGLEEVAVPACALVHLVVDVEAELRARDPLFPTPAWKVNRDCQVSKSIKKSI